MFNDFKYILSKEYWHAALLLTKVSVLRQNKHSFLGSIWSLIQPFLHILIITYFFGFLLGQSRLIMINNLVGSLPFWTFFCSTLTITSCSLIDREMILKKVIISKTIFSVADTLTQIYILFYSFIAMYSAFIMLYPSEFHWQIIFLPITLAPLLICSFSSAIAVSFLTPYLRDIPQMLNVILSALYWTIPIIYPYSMVPESKRVFFELNPIFLIIRPIQSLIIDGYVDFRLLFKAVIVSIIILLVSYLIYKLCSRRVVYYL